VAFGNDPLDLVGLEFFRVAFHVERARFSRFPVVGIATLRSRFEVRNADYRVDFLLLG